MQTFQSHVRRSVVDGFRLKRYRALASHYAKRASSTAPRSCQDEEYPPGEWSFLFQLDGSDDFYDVNFGDAGVGYGLVSIDRREGRFLWQCA